MGILHGVVYTSIKIELVHTEPTNWTAGRTDSCGTGL